MAKVPSLTDSAPELESGALFERLFPASPQRWLNQPEVAPQVQGRMSIASWLLLHCSVPYLPRASIVILAT
jgi:hypothetical protein